MVELQLYQTKMQSDDLRSGLAEVTKITSRDLNISTSTINYLHGVLQRVDYFHIALQSPVLNSEVIEGLR